MEEETKDEQNGWGGPEAGTNITSILSRELGGGGGRQPWAKCTQNSKNSIRALMYVGFRERRQRWSRATSGSQITDILELEENTHAGVAC